MSANSVSARVARITGQTPPISASAIKQRGFRLHAPQQPHRLGLVGGLGHGVGGAGEQHGKMLVRIGLQHMQQTRRLAARQLPEKRRAFGEAFDQRLEVCIGGKQRLKRLRLGVGDLRQPFGDARLRGARIVQPRRRANAIGQRLAGGRLGAARGHLQTLALAPVRGHPATVYRPSPRQGNHAFQPRVIVLERQFAAMQARHRRGKAQAQPEARLRAALLEAHEAFDHARTVAFRDAGAAIGHGEQNAVAVVERAQHDFRPLAVDLGGIRLAVFDGIVEQIGDRLAHQLAVALDRRGAVGLDLERDALLLGQRLVKLADVAGDLGGVEIDHVVARLAGFGARDHQQRVEGADQPVRFLERGIERGAIFRLALGRAQGLLGAVAQTRERRLQIMGDVVGDFLQARHQRLDAVEHGVEVVGETVELVAGAGDRAAGRSCCRP